MSKMFDFNAASYAGPFAERGFVHIPHGLSEEFHSRLATEVAAAFDARHMKEFARGDKQQALFEFFEPSHYDELRDMVSAVCGVEVESLTLSERHIKQYEDDADPYPLAHKDRFGSEVAVGFSIAVPEGSTLVLYPEHDLTPNPFNSTAELRASFSPDDVPEPALKSAARMTIQDRPGDVMLFLGNSIWHLREHGAGTTVLYLKLNTYNCDTLGEDPHTARVRQSTLKAAEEQASGMSALVPVIGRAVDYIQHRYSRDWSELYGVVQHGRPHLTITKEEFAILRALDGQHTVGEIVDQKSAPGEKDYVRESLRRLAARGIVDLMPHRISIGQIRHKSLSRAA